MKKVLSILVLVAIMIAGTTAFAADRDDVEILIGEVIENETIDTDVVFEMENGVEYRMVDNGDHYLIVKTKHCRVIQAIEDKACAVKDAVTGTFQKGTAKIKDLFNRDK